MQLSFEAAKPLALGAAGDSARARVDERVLTSFENAMCPALGHTGSPRHTQSGSTGRGHRAARITALGDSHLQVRATQSGSTCRGRRVARKQLSAVHTDR
ncbi:hypothetical protein NDU88_007275 [Pleurodeles waltl]|uniref:Uncharacterized protein n=1 Tax=Pleurodeles waltl TaxID=8319 RepID=A0AAV7N9R0_PLEWA|nr:hypothetical protein NDU88_007275 [Pleurodeles waltl]